jgi:hypothetical protein
MIPSAAPSTSNYARDTIVRSTLLDCDWTVVSCKSFRTGAEGGT